MEGIREGRGEGGRDGRVWREGGEGRDGREGGREAGREGIEEVGGKVGGRKGREQEGGETGRQWGGIFKYINFIRRLILTNIMCHSLYTHSRNMSHLENICYVDDNTYNKYQKRDDTMKGNFSYHHVHNAP